MIEGNEFEEMRRGIRRDSAVLNRRLLERRNSMCLDRRILQIETGTQLNLLLAFRPENRYKYPNLQNTLEQALQAHYTQEQITASFAQSLDQAFGIAEKSGYLVITDDANVARDAIAQGNAAIYVDDTSKSKKEALKKEGRTRTVIGKYHLDIDSNKLREQLISSVEEIVAQYHPEPEKLKILILDDEGVDSGLMRLYRQELENLGYEVIITDNEEDAMYAVNDRGIDLAILDYCYDPKDPEGKENNGLQLAARIRAYHPDLPIVLNTGREDLIPELEEKAPQYRVDAVVLKSADFDLFIETVQNLMMTYHGKIDIDEKEVFQDLEVPEKTQK